MISWTQANTFLKCPRRYKFRYIDQYQHETFSKSRMLGQAVHAGLAAINDNPLEAARKWVADNTPEMKLDRQGQLDHAFYALMNDIEHQAVQLLTFHIPHIQRRFTILETEFEVSNDFVHGVVDALAADEAGNLILIDWKVRSKFPPDDAVWLDGQLHLYAALTPGVTQVCQYQIKSKLPSPASISVRSGLPNTGAASYDTTWEHWVATLPLGIQAEEYRDLMMPKLKRLDDFARPIIGEVTEFSSQQSLDNMRKISEMISQTRDYPGIEDATVCQFCDFWRLCAGPLRYGGDIDFLLQAEGWVNEESNTEE